MKIYCMGKILIDKDILIFNSDPQTKGHLNKLKNANYKPWQLITF